MKIIYFINNLKNKFIKRKKTIENDINKPPLFLNIKIYSTLSDEYIYYDVTSDDEGYYDVTSDEEGYYDIL